MIKKILFASVFFILAVQLLYSGTDNETLKEQSPVIQKIISNEDDNSTRKKLVGIIDYIDTTYGGIYENLSNGGKITIYFGPAHGKDHTEEWRGITTNRIGVTGLPEEYYSIKYSRKLYNLLKANPFIEIAAKPEYRQVLEGKSESYHYMKFKDVMREARDANAFMVIEMHMNNVSIFSKADGLINMPGIHLARDKNGARMLINITSRNSGFLTLYNKYDASDFSRQYAVNIRQSLVKKGYIANGWDYGAVADDRFTYYLNFPISIIYECGFISDTEEERKLQDPEYMDGMVQTHYEMLLKTFNDMFGIDISGDEIEISRKDFSDNIELLKLARVAVFYIQMADTAQANIAIREMKKRFYFGNHKGVIDYYCSIISRINKSESLYAKGRKYHNRKKYKKARKYFVYARNNLRNNELFSAYKRKYNSAIYGNRRQKRESDTAYKKISRRRNSEQVQREEASVIVDKSPVTKPVILIIRKNQTIEQSVIDALAPDAENLDNICRSLKNHHVYHKKKVKKYSKKRKRYIYRYVRKKRKYEFNEGIYIVNLDKKKRVVKAKRVSSVYLNQKKYQNQQYLKNSYFADTEKQKTY